MRHPSRTAGAPRPQPRRPVRGTALGTVRVIARAAVAVCLAVTLAACGRAKQADLGDEPSIRATKSNPTIGVLLPDSHTLRWETFDRPLIEKTIRELCPACRILGANAHGAVASQKAQLESMITKGVDVLILDAIDTKALSSSVVKADMAGIPVIAYDRLAEGPISGYVSFDGVEVGRLQGTALIKGMGAKADGGQIVMLNGDPADPNAVAFERGALSVLEGRVKIGKSYDIDRWQPDIAHVRMSGAIAALGADAIDGVYAANDGLAAGAIASLKGNFIEPLPPVTGQDADLAAIQRIVQGDQYMTVYKPFKPQAEAAAAMAVALGRGDSLDDIARDEALSSTGRWVPAVLLTPIAVTAGNVRSTVVKDGMYTIDQICTSKFASACAKTGLTV